MRVPDLAPGMSTAPLQVNTVRFIPADAQRMQATDLGDAIGSVVVQRDCRPAAAVGLAVESEVLDIFEMQRLTGVEGLQAAEIHGVDAVATIDGMDTIQRVGAVEVVGIDLEEGVVAAAAGHRIMPGAAEEAVVVPAAEQRVVAGAAVDDVLAIAAVDDVVA